MLSRMVGFFERRVVHQEAELFGRQRLRLCRVVQYAFCGVLEVVDALVVDVGS